MERFTDDELSELGQIIVRCVKPDTSWIIVMIPPHNCEEHEPGDIPVQLISNLKDPKWAADVLTAGARMFETGEYETGFVQRGMNH